MKTRIMIGLTLITIGMFYLSSNYIKEKRELVFSEMNLEINGETIPLEVSGLDFEANIEG